MEREATTTVNRTIGMSINVDLNQLIDDRGKKLLKQEEIDVLQNKGITVEDLAYLDSRGRPKVWDIRVILGSVKSGTTNVGGRRYAGPYRVDKTLRKAALQVITDPTMLCTECGGELASCGNGDLACSQCGLVSTNNRETFDYGPEWRAFTADEQNSRARTGAPANMMRHDKGLSTVIDTKMVDAHGKRLSSGRRAEIYRLRKWHLRSQVHSSLSRNLSRALTEIERLCGQVGISGCMKGEAAVLYRKVATKRLLRGQSIEAMAAAVLYATCRMQEKPRYLDEFADASPSTRKEIGKHYRFLVERIGIRMPTSKPINYVSRFADELKLPSPVRVRALKVMSEANERSPFSGRDPKGLAAASIYLAAILENIRVTQKQVSIVSGVTEVTIRNRYKELVDVMEFDSESVKPKWRGKPPGQKRTK